MGVTVQVVGVNSTAATGSTRVWGEVQTGTATAWGAVPDTQNSSWSPAPTMGL